MGTPRTSAVSTLASGPGVAAYTQMLGEWVKVIDDTEIDPVLAAVMLNPRSYSSAGIHPIIVTQGSYLRLIARYNSTTLGPTSPTFRAFGANTVPSATGAYPSGTIFWRLDASTFTAASSSFTISSGNDQNDPSTDYAYSTVFTHNGMNLHGAKSVLVMHDGFGTNDGLGMPVYAQLLNG